jgi:ketosteroid isomerase-like protein
MLVRLSMAVSLLLLAFTVACTQAPPPDTHDADVQALKDTEAAWAKAVGAKDFEKGMSYYADDASLLLPNAPIVNGKDAVRAALKPLMEDSNFSLTFAATRADVAKSGDLGYTVGTYTMTMSDPKTKKPITDKGKYLTAYRKQADGTWKAVADMDSSDVPLPAPGKK